MLLKQIEREMAQGREVRGPIPAPDPAVVLAEGHVQYPMASVINLPIGTYGAGNVRGQRSDEITPLAADLPLYALLAFGQDDALQTRTALPGVVVQPSVQLPGPQLIGQPLGTAQVGHAQERIVSHGEIDAGRAQLTRQPPRDRCSKTAAATDTRSVPADRTIQVSRR